MLGSPLSTSSTSSWFVIYRKDKGIRSAGCGSVNGPPGLLNNLPGNTSSDLPLFTSCSSLVSRALRSNEIIRARSALDVKDVVLWLPLSRLKGNVQYRSIYSQAVPPVSANMPCSKCPPSDHPHLALSWDSLLWKLCWFLDREKD